MISDFKENVSSRNECRAVRQFLARPAGGSKVKQQLHQNEGGGLQCGVWRSAELLRCAQSVWLQHRWSCIFVVFFPLFISVLMNENKPTRGRKRLTDTGYKRRFARDNLMLWGIKCVCWEQTSVAHELTRCETGYMTKDTLLRRDFHMLKLVFISYSIWHGRLSSYWGK